MVYLLNLCFYFLAEALRKALTILINAISLSLVFAFLHFLLGRKLRKTNATRVNIRADVRGLGRRKQKVLQIHLYIYIYIYIYVCMYIYKLRRKARYWGITNLLVSAEPSGPVEQT